MNTSINRDTLLEEEYHLRLKVNQLRQAIYQNPGFLPSQDQLDRLKQAEQILSISEQKRVQANANDPRSNGLIIDTKKHLGMLGAQTTGLEVRTQLRMAQIPTAIYHLLDPVEYPLITCNVSNVMKDKTRRVRVISYIDGYSAQAVDTIELEPNKAHDFNQHPTLFPDRLLSLTELAHASLNIMLEDIDGKLELHKSYPIWLLPKHAAYLEIWDPEKHLWKDMSQYLGAFVTPNEPILMKFLRSAAEHHPKKSFLGYQGDEKNISPQEIVDPQVKAIFTALKKDAGITYVNSLVAFNPEEDITNVQRVRLPTESLKDRQANCIDGTVLFASLLEGITLSPAIVLVPGHAFVAWETWGGYNEWSNEWKYLETTMIHDFSFEDACDYAQHLAEHYKQKAAETNDPSQFIFWPLRVLRSRYQIVPMQ